eukprot:gene7041-11206_t
MQKLVGDVLYMNENDDGKVIVCIIDVFTKYCWLFLVMSFTIQIDYPKNLIELIGQTLFMNGESLLQLEALENYLENTRELNLQDKEYIYMAKKAEVLKKLMLNIETLKDLIDHDKKIPLTTENSKELVALEMCRRKAELLYDFW